MLLLLIYMALVIVGDFADYLIGLVVERYWPEASLPVFLLLYFTFLWLAWIVAVKVTGPRNAAAKGASAA